MLGPRAVVLLALATGCYAPTPPEGAPCSVATELCPSSMTCVAGHCTSDPVACTPIVAGPGTLTAPRLVSPLVLDGDLGDWPTCFVTVDRTSAGLVRDLGAAGSFPTGRFSLAYDDAHLYIGAEVSGVPPLGDHPLPAVYENNAISVYLDADGVFTQASYDADAAQIVVDHANREQAFRSGQTVALPKVVSFARADQNTFTIELAVEPATFGRAAFSSSIGFDIGFVGGDGATMSSELVWFQRCAAPACGCMNGDSAPYCDAREFGTLGFAP